MCYWLETTDDQLNQCRMANLISSKLYEYELVDLSNYEQDDFPSTFDYYSVLDNLMEQRTND